MRDMLMKGKTLVKENTEITNARRKQKCRTIDSNALGKRIAITESFRKDENELSLFFIKLQFIFGHPKLQISDAVLETNNKITKT